MPHILFTLDEIVDPLITRTRALSDELLALSDLEKTPLTPGESPDARRHKIAKLGKQLAESFKALDGVFAEAAKQLVDGSGPPAVPTATPERQSN